MSGSKLLLIGLALIAGSIAVFFLLGFVISLLPYLIIGGLLLVGGVGAYKYFAKPRNLELDQKETYNVITDAEDEMLKTDKLLSEYRQKLLHEEKRK